MPAALRWNSYQNNLLVLEICDLMYLLSRNSGKLDLSLNEQGKKVSGEFFNNSNLAPWYFWCVYTYTYVYQYMDVYKMYTNTYIFTHMVMLLASRLLHWICTTKFRPYRSQKCSPFALQGPLSLAHNIPGNTTWQKDGAQQKASFPHSLHLTAQPSTQNPAVSNPTLSNLLAILRLSLEGGNRKKSEAETGLQWLGYLGLSGSLHWTQGAGLQPPLFLALSFPCSPFSSFPSWQN